jgi:uncharacterized repeat protein (TIGR01451 family)
MPTVQPTFSCLDVSQSYVSAPFEHERFQRRPAQRSGTPKKRTRVAPLLSNGLRFFLIVVLSIPVLFLASPAMSATRNVSGAAGCSDTTGNPYCTINAAILAASAGDTIQIAAGTYAGTIASFSKSLTFIGAGSSTSGTVITKAVTYTGVGPLSLSNLRISGGGTNFKVSGTGNFSGLTLSGDTFVGNGGGAHGAYIKQSGTVSNVTVTNCSLTNHGQSGMLIEPGTSTTTDVDHVTVSGSTFDSNGEYGLRIDPHVTNLQVSSSNITNNAIDGLLLLNANGATFQNLTITGNRNGILLIPLTSAQSISNLTFTNVNASNNTRFISGHYGSGLTLTGGTGAISNITITGSTFSGNGIHGVDSTGAVSQLSIDCSAISANVQQGLHEASSPSTQASAQHVYWGCANGPNSAGCSTLTGNVDYLPFRSSPTASCTASVDLAVSATAGPNPVPTGGTLTYTATVSNNGPDPATGVALADTLPAGVAFVTASTGCALNGAMVTCTIGNLAAGALAVSTITVTAPTSPGTITNSVTIQGNETPDPNPSNDSATVTTTVQATVSLSNIMVTPANVTISAGEIVQFTATATYSDSTTQDVTGTALWLSSGNRIAGISAGKLMGLGAGSVTVTAAQGAISGAASVTVTPTPIPVALSLVPLMRSLAVGTSTQLAARVTYLDGSTADAGASVAWTSSAPSVVTASSGLLTGVTKGFATITATYQSFTAVAHINVTSSTETCSSLYIKDTALWLFDGSVVRQVLQDPLGIFLPRLSPDGTRIAYQQNPDAPTEAPPIIVADTATGVVLNTVSLTTLPVNALMQLGWRTSPERLFLDGHVNPSVDLYYEADPATNTFSAETATGQLSVSPDGLNLINDDFVPHGAPPPHDRSVALLNGVPIYPPTTDTAYHRFASTYAWSQDSAYVALVDTTPDSDTVSIAILRASDGMLLSATPVPENLVPRPLAWTPAGNVVFQVSAAYYLLTVDGTLTQLPDAPTELLQPFVADTDGEFPVEDYRCFPTGNSQRTPLISALKGSLLASSRHLVFSVDNSTPAPGSSVQVTIALPHIAPHGGTLVTLISASGAAHMPSAVRVHEGERLAHFVVQASPTGNLLRITARTETLRGSLVLRLAAKSHPPKGEGHE